MIVFSLGERERQRETDRQTYRDRHRDRDGQADRQRGREGKTERHRQREKRGGVVLIIFILQKNFFE